jgi:hypothetical protein
MLGFDAYTKSNFGAILEQRIRIFFSKRFLINYPIILQIKSSNNEVEINNLVNTTFDTFKKELEKKNLYYHYAVSSLLLDNPDYDFLTNNEQDTIELADESIKKIYSDVVKDVLGSYNADITLSETNKLFSFLKSPTYHRLIPSYSKTTLSGLKFDLLDFERDPVFGTELESLPGVNEFKAPGSQALSGLSSTAKAKNEELRFKDQGKNVPISRMPSPLYIEYFWRMLPSEEQTSQTSGSDFEKLLKDNYESKFGELWGSPIKTFKELRQKYYYAGEAEKYKYIGLYKFQRGVRLMYNLTAFIKETDKTYKVKLKDKTYTFRTLEPKQWLPMFGINNYKNVPNEEAHPFPLPFLTNYIDKDTANSEGTGFKQGSQSFLQNAYLKMAGTTNPGEMKARIRNRKDPANITLKNDLYFTNTYGTTSGGETFDVNRNFYWAYSKLINYPKVDFFKMRSSKSLISFEIESVKTEETPALAAIPIDADPKKPFIGKLTEYLNLYFPIILAEELEVEELSGDAVEAHSTTIDQIPAFQKLVEKLLSDNNKQVKYLRSTMKYDGDNGIKGFLTVKKTDSTNLLKDIISKNEENLKVMMGNEQSAKKEEAIYNSIPEPARSNLFPSGPVYEKAVFFDTTEIENSLDNLLLNLINFDEET